MRKLIFAINISLDGCCEHNKFGPPDEEIMEFFTQLNRDSDTFLYGRKTYELMVPYWPDVLKNPSGYHREVDIAYARAFNAIERIVVFSQSLTNAEEKRTTIFSTDLYEEVLKLKQQSGKNITTGGITLAAQLSELGLIDEYILVVHPVIVGEGRRLFEGIGLQERLRLKLIESTAFKSGAVVLKYAK